MLGWSVGTFAGTGSDKLVGSGAAGLEVNSRKFSMLPAHVTIIGTLKWVGRLIGEK